MYIPYSIIYDHHFVIIKFVCKELKPYSVSNLKYEYI